MKKLTVVLMAGMFILAGCGCSDGSKGGKVAGEVYETDVWSVLVPEGWTGFPDFQFQSEEINHDRVFMSKGNTQRNGIAYYPGVILGRSSSIGKDLCENIEELKPFKAGNFTWEGYTGTWNGTPYVFLAATNPKNNASVRLNIRLEKVAGAGVPAEVQPITFDDADVQAIIKSVTMKD